MRHRLDPRLKLARIQLPGYPHGDDHNGAFQIQGPQGRRLSLIVSDGMGWDHVSVSVHAEAVTPNWEEMCWVKDLIFEPGECVIQYHPPKTSYVNIHHGCLHLWRPQIEAVPMPALHMV